MRTYCLLLILLTPVVYGQEAENMAVQQTVERFFEGFHARDTAKINSTIGKGIVLQTISKKNDGGNEVLTESFHQFLKSIVSIPDSVAFREEIQRFRISIDGPMANAWTPYKFWLNDTFSHCGVNSFQLAKGREGWKIIYLIDTRRKEDCP